MRCPHCSFQPTSREDYCDEHRDAITVDLTTSERRLLVRLLTDASIDASANTSRDRLLKVLRFNSGGS